MEDSSIRLRKDAQPCTESDGALIEIVEETEQPDHPLPLSQAKTHSTRQAMWCALLVPGLGQFYNFQVSKALFIFLFNFISLGSTVLYLTALVLKTVVSSIGDFIVGLTHFLLTFLTRPLEWCSDPESAGICSAVRALIVYAGQAYVAVEMGSLWVLETLLSFPPPPLTSSIFHLANHLTENSFLSFTALALVFGMFYAYQMLDAKWTATEIANGSIKIEHSRKRQLVRIFTLNFLPYILLLLPIPGGKYLVEILFVGMAESVGAFVDNVGNEKSTHSSPSHLDRDTLLRQCKALLKAKTIEFLEYSLIVLVIVVYLIWYLLIILLWTFRLFF